ncbi:hypothetical protein BH24BAC1_BH24BAC1_37540 [soil metagenome]
MRFSTLKSKNPKHLRKGTSGYWMEQLTEEQVERAEIIAGPLLGHLHYPRERNQPMTIPGGPAHQDFESLKEEIIFSQQPLYQQ